MDFFEETLGAPNPMPGNNQTWWIKEAFNLVGLIGFFGAIVSFAALMLELPFFAGLKAQKEIVVPALADKKSKR